MRIRKSAGIFGAYFTAMTISFILGMWLIFSGITKLVNSFDLQKLGVGCGVFESVKSACVKIVLTDKTFSSSGVNYDEVFSRYKMTDNLLNPV